MCIVIPKVTPGSFQESRLSAVSLLRIRRPQAIFLYKMRYKISAAGENFYVLGSISKLFRAKTFNFNVQKWPAAGEYAKAKRR